jgi:hypothetical protein
MRSGDRPGLQNRRAASTMSPVCSTHTRFRQFSRWAGSSSDFAVAPVTANLATSQAK